MSDGDPAGLRGLSGVSDRAQQLLAILDNIADPVVAFDKQWRYTYVSRRAAQALGMEPEQMLGRSMWDLFPGDIDTGFQEACRRAWEEGKAVTVERYSAVLGAWVESYIYPFEDGATTQWRDITGRRRAEEAVRSSEEQLRQRVEELETVMNVAPVAIWVAHHPKCDHITGNRMANECYEAAPDENVSCNVTEARRFFRDGRELRAEELPMQEAAAQGKDVRGAEVEVLLPSGRRLSMLGHASPLRDADGRVRGCVGAFLDVSEHKRTEERLRQAQKLESVGLLAGGIAHDFNNLLTGVIGNASILLEDGGGEYAGIARAILASAERAAGLTRQLLAYAGKGQFILHDIDVSQAVNQMSGLLQFSIPKSVGLKLDLEQRLPMVRMDPSQLQQILMNLVINAGEAIGEMNTGKITVSTGLVDFEAPFVDALGREAAPGRYVSIEVSDTGGGIDDAALSKIFDPFFTTKFTGRGLGLAAVAGVVRSQKGAIMVDSTPGRGTTFRVLLPAAEHQPEQECPDEAGRVTILVVDDESSVRDFIGSALRRQGYRVLLARDGRDALNLCDRARGDIDAAVVDVVMPVMGAQDLLPALLARRPKIKVLLTSGYSESEVRRLCAQYPGAAFLQKPYTARAITGALEALLGWRPPVPR